MQISVIIPTCGRTRELTLCLEGLKKQTLKPGEIIIVNDSCVGVPNKFQGVKVIATRGRTRLPLRASPLAEQSEAARGTGGQVGPGRAKNAGARIARGEVLAFLDDDCVPSPHWLAEIVRPFKDREIAVVAGKIVEKHLRNKLGTFSDIILNLPFYPFYLLCRKRAGGTIYFNGRVDARLSLAIQGFCDWGGAGNLAVRNSYFQKVGGFEENFLPGPNLEEPDLCLRIKKRGGKVFYNGQAFVIHSYSPGGRLAPLEAAKNLKANEVYFGLKNIAFQNIFTFVAFFAYQAWQILIYSLLALIEREYWQRVRGKFKGFARYKRIISNQ